MSKFKAFMQVRSVGPGPDGVEHVMLGPVAKSSGNGMAVEAWLGDETHGEDPHYTTGGVPAARMDIMVSNPDLLGQIQSGQGFLVTFQPIDLPEMPEDAGDEGLVEGEQPEDDEVEDADAGETDEQVDI